MSLTSAPDWLPPDADGICTAWLTDPARASLRGRRLRRTFNPQAAALDTWPASWRELLSQWVRRATLDRTYRHDRLLATAGADRANTALALFRRLLAEGLVEVEERRDRQRGWQAYSLRFGPLSERDRTLLEQLCRHGLPTTLAALAADMLKMNEKGEQESLFW